LYRFDIIGLTSNSNKNSKEILSPKASLITTFIATLDDAKKVYLGRNPIINNQILLILLQKTTNRVVVYSSKIQDKKFNVVGTLQRQNGIMDFDAVVVSNVISIFTTDGLKLGVDAFELSAYT